ncbi:hypothetical protein MBLNU13_g02748t1 [Cladosporium sp. NU13]
MSKLSESLKTLINVAHVRPHTTPAPKNITSIYEKIATDAKAKQVGLPAWLCASTAATMTLNSPESLLQLYALASASKPATANPSDHPVYTAELMREVGLKCIGFNGVPRTINCLNAFRDGLPSDIQSALAERKPRRMLARDNVDDVLDRGHGLWNSIYAPFSSKLIKKLSSSHPDLPVHIVESEYGALFSDPAVSAPHGANVGRVLTSVVAVACLRAQTGVGPQVLSHVFGLRKAVEGESVEEDVEGAKWLASDEGSEWLLRKVDEVVTAIGGGFAGGYGELKAKL